jgi:hypothetical protein
MQIKTDFRQFAELLDQAYALQSARVLSAEAKALFFAAVADHSLDSVRSAIFAHLRDPVNGKFPVQPSHITAQLAQIDGRPGADEAWAVALTSVDERMTVVWTTETLDAFLIARTVLDAGDETGARMAFKDAYNRLVGNARRAGRPVAWQPSLGWDAQVREKVLRAAAAANQLAAPMVAALLPAPEEQSEYDEHRARANLQRIREQVASIPSSLERMAAAKARQAEYDQQIIRERKAALREQAEALGLSDDGYEELRQS